MADKPLTVPPSADATAIERVAWDMATEIMKNSGKPASEWDETAIRRLYRRCWRTAGGVSVPKKKA